MRSNPTPPTPWCVYVPVCIKRRGLRVRVHIHIVKREFIYVCIHICIYAGSLVGHTGCRRVMGYFIFIGHFPQKSPIISGSSAKNDLHLKVCYGSSLPCSHACCTHQRSCVYVCVCVCVCVY